MILLLLAYLGGVLTIVSPCILPVLPFVFARAGQPFLHSTLPTLLGMVLAFAAVATLAAVGGGWAVEANQYGRFAAMALLAMFGIALLFPALADRIVRPLVALGGHLSDAVAQHGSGSGAVLPSLLLGLATGLLWAPCAGPILGLILTGAALQGANAATSLLLLAYAGGTATSLAVAILAGGKIFALMKRSLGVGVWLRRAGGVAVLAAVAVIALGLDTGFLTQLSLASTSALEQRLLDRFDPAATPPAAPTMMSGTAPAMNSGNPAVTGSNPAMMAAKLSGTEAKLPVEGTLPSLAGAVVWLNSPPLTAEGLKGKVVLVDFWTYSCINCLRAIPYVRAWAEKYKDQGLVVIGVHTPEFAFEKRIDNVKQAVSDLKIAYPVAVDNDYAIWRAVKNQYWPAHYFIDAEGRIRHHHFGEGAYEASEKVIQQLLAESGRADVAKGTVSVRASGAEMASDEADVRSPETYLGYERAENFVSPGGAVEDAASRYEPGMPRLNEWGLSGQWTIGKEHAGLDAPDGGITYRFHARDLHLVLGPAADGKPVRFRVTIDGAVPGADHGIDIDAEGNGTVTGQRLYQLVRQGGPVKDRTFEIWFLDAGAQAYAFTFG